MVDSALYEAVLNMMESLIPDYDKTGHIRERTGAILPKLAPSNIYPSADGMVLIAGNQDTVFARLCEARSEEHTSELQSLMRISYAVFCLKKKNKQQPKQIL